MSSHLLYCPVHRLARCLVPSLLTGSIQDVGLDIIDQTCRAVHLSLSPCPCHLSCTVLHSGTCTTASLLSLPRRPHRPSAILTSALQWFVLYVLALASLPCPYCYSFLLRLLFRQRIVSHQRLPCAQPAAARNSSDRIEPSKSNWPWIITSASLVFVVLPNCRMSCSIVSVGPWLPLELRVLETPPSASTSCRSAPAHLYHIGSVRHTTRPTISSLTRAHIFSSPTWKPKNAESMAAHALKDIHHRVGQSETIADNSHR